MFVWTIATVLVLFVIFIQCRSFVHTQPGEGFESKKQDRFTSVALIISFLVLPVASCSSSKPRQRSKKESRVVSKAPLAETGIELLRDGNADGYVDLMFTAEEVFKVCPHFLEEKDRFQGFLDKIKKKTRVKIGKCNEMIDWSRAKQVGFEGGEVKTKVERDWRPCTGDIKFLRDIKYHFEVDGKKFTVKLEGPMIISGEHGFMDDPTCQTSDY